MDDLRKIVMCIFFSGKDLARRESYLCLKLVLGKPEFIDRKIRHTEIYVHRDILAEHRRYQHLVADVI